MGKRWTTADDTFLIHHVQDGVYLVAEALGRTVHAVHCRASRLGVSFPHKPGQFFTCPRCGGHYTVSTGSYRHGFCETCWYIARKETIEQRREEYRAQKEYTRVKTAFFRERKKAGNAE